MTAFTPPAKAKNILIFGATGTIGAPITNILVSHIKSYESITIFTSSPNNVALEPWKAAGVHVITGSITSTSDVQAAYDTGIDTVICCLGRTAILPQLQLIELAEQTPNILRFIPSEFGTDIEHPSNSAKNKDEVPHQGKIKVRAALRRSEKLDWTFIVTGPYSDTFLTVGTVENGKAGSWDVQKRKAVLVGTESEPVSFTACKDVGKIVHAVLQHPALSSRRALYVQSFLTTAADILAEFEAQTGTKWDVSYTSIEELEALEAKVYKDKNAGAPLVTLRRIWAKGGTLYDKWDNEKLEAGAMESVGDQVRQAITRQTKNS